MCNENKGKKKQRLRKIFLWWKGEFVSLYQKSGETDFDELQDTVFILNEGTNSLVTSQIDVGTKRVP